MALEAMISGLSTLYSDILAAVPAGFGGFLNIFLVTLFVVAYSVFIWKLSKFIGTRNLLELNLNQYNNSEHPFVSKIVSVGLYFLEYIIILPFLVFFWFAVLTIFLILFTEHLEIQNIIVISATVIAAIRMVAYIPNYGERVARELAKLIPLNLLAISLLYPGIVDFERVLGQINQIPALLSLTATYLIFIVFLEVLLRFFDFLIGFIGLEEIEPKKRKGEVEEED